MNSDPLRADYSVDTSDSLRQLHVRSTTAADDTADWLQGRVVERPTTRSFPGLETPLDGL